MGVDTFGLFVGQTGNGRMEFLHGDFALVNFTWRKSNEQGRVLNAVLPVKLCHCLRYLVRHFDKRIHCIVRVKIPKIDDSHVYLRFGVW